MNLENPKDQELHDLIEELAEKSDIQGMTDLLVNWEEKSLLWLIFVESRIIAPSTTEEQREALEKAKEVALAEDEVLRREYNPYMDNLPKATEEDSDDGIDDDVYEDDDEDETSLMSNQQKKDSNNWEEGKDMKTAESYILSEEASKNETAEQAYQRLLEAEKLIATCEGYNYFDPEVNEYREGWREKEATKTSGKKLEKWEKKHFKLDEGYKQFVIKHGYVSFGTDVEDYYLEELNNDMRTLADAFLGEYEYSKEEIEERYDGDYSHLEDLLVIGWGDAGLQIHYFILMDKEGGFYLFDQDDWDTIDERYTFDEFVSKVANLVIGNMIDYW